MASLPIRDSMPPAAHTTRLRPTDPVSWRTPLGEMKIPEPATQQGINPYRILHCIYKKLQSMLL